MKATLKYAEELRTFQPIQYEGLMFYPLQVRHFALYQNAKPAMELMLSTLPVRYVRLSWIHALEALDKEADGNSVKTGFLGSFLLLLDAALKTDVLHNKAAMLPLSGKDGRFSALLVKQGENAPVALRENDFPIVREILAAQNNYSIPDENWNPDLVRAQVYLREQDTGSARGGSLEDAVFALAAATGHRSAEIWDWPIREFVQMQSAVDRRLRFQIWTTAELSGQVKFSQGNPFPTWVWETKSELPRGFTSLNDLEKGANGVLTAPND